MGAGTIGITLNGCVVDDEQSCPARRTRYGHVLLIRKTDACRPAGDRLWDAGCGLLEMVSTRRGWNSVPGAICAELLEGGVDRAVHRAPRPATFALGALKGAGLSSRVVKYGLSAREDA